MHAVGGWSTLLSVSCVLQSLIFIDIDIDIFVNPVAVHPHFSHPRNACGVVERQPGTSSCVLWSSHPLLTSPSGVPT
jgi:hypothetical protein